MAHISQMVQQLLSVAIVDTYLYQEPSASSVTRVGAKLGKWWGVVESSRQTCITFNGVCKLARAGGAVAGGRVHASNLDFSSAASHSLKTSANGKITEKTSKGYAPVARIAPDSQPALKAAAEKVFTEWANSDFIGFSQFHTKYVGKSPSSSATSKPQAKASAPVKAPDALSESWDSSIPADSSWQF